MRTLMHRTILFLFVCFLASCSPSLSSPAPTTLPAQPGETQLESPEVQALEPTKTIPIPTATSTPLPTSTTTPEPVADLHDISTWPVEMQDYFNRPPEEWNNPSKQYVSGSEFNRFFQQARRDFLTNHGIDTAHKTDEEIFLEYRQWAFDNKQIGVWSPQEITQVRGGAFTISWTEGTAKYAPVHGGNNRSANLRIDPESEGLISQLLTEHMYTVTIFGTDVNLTPNAGYMGINAGLVRIPGVDPQDEVLIYLTYRENNITYDDLISIPLQPTSHNVGIPILDGHQTVISVNTPFTLSPAINGLCSGGQDFCLNGRKMPFLTLQDLLNGFGQVTIVNPYYASPSDRAELNSIGDLGPHYIERGYAVGFFPDLSLIDMSLPWDE